MKYKKILTIILMLETMLNAETISTSIEETIFQQQEEIKRLEQQQRSGESMFINKDSVKSENQSEIIKNNISAINKSYQNPNYQNYEYQQAQIQAPQQEITEEQIMLMKQALRNKDLKAVQKKFLEKKYNGYENTKEVFYENGKTQKIRTRFTMATTLIFETDITGFILGDPSGFKAEEIPNKTNSLSIKPLLIGIDTNLTIFTKDNKIHNFYIYSTDYKNGYLPDLIVRIIDNESKKLVRKQEEEEKEKYLIIQQGIAKLKVEKDKIQSNYKIKAKKENQWLIPKEVFNDEAFTYFKYEKSEQTKIPTIFAVIDKYDTPIETKVIGDYIIAETRNNKWTIWSGNSYVCVEKVEKDLLNANAKAKR